MDIISFVNAFVSGALFILGVGALARGRIFAANVNFALSFVNAFVFFL